MVIVPSNHGHIAIFEVSDPEVSYVKKHPNSNTNNTVFCGA
jgi:uncharacterized phage-like protein YoqJ